MKMQSYFLAAGLLSTCLVWSARAQDTNTPNTTSTPPAQSAKTPAGVDEVLKMMKAGVTTDVMVNYVENAYIPYRLEPNDIINLKQQGVPDAVVSAMLKRGANIRTQIEQTRASIAARNTGNGNNSQMDPEGYDYFQYYYLYPRTLAQANQRLYEPGPYTGFFPYAYGYGPAPYQAYSPMIFRRR